jgi:hypothetical protein
VWRFLLLLVIVAVGSYYAARFLLEGFPRKGDRTESYRRPMGPDDDDEFLAQLSRREKGPDEPG